MTDSLGVPGTDEKPEYWQVLVDDEDGSSRGSTNAPYQDGAHWGLGCRVVHVVPKARLLEVERERDAYRKALRRIWEDYGCECGGREHRCPWCIAWRALQITEVPHAE